MSIYSPEYMNFSRMMAQGSAAVLNPIPGFTASVSRYNHEMVGFLPEHLRPEAIANWIKIGWW